VEEKIRFEIKVEIEASFKAAQNAPFPDPDTARLRVYA
jgi:TPP-dependent pyruvate/acetoin dehydrogenase alpha subunit